MKYIVGLFLLFPFIVFSQQEIAKKHVQQLASPKMYGRGYVNNGVGIAANYIDSCFTSYNLKQFPALEGYHQKVSYPVNTFPGIVKLRINDSLLIPGQDYIIDPSSASIKGTFNSVYSTKTRVSNGKITGINLKKLILVLNESYYTSGTDNEQIQEINKWIEYNKKIKNQMPCIIELSNNKLTWSVSEERDKMAYIYVKTEKNSNVHTGKIDIQIDEKFIKKYNTANICGYIPGTQFPDSMLVFTAHYDHLGMMGNKTMFPGANDNASGVAMLLNLAEYYAKHPQKYSIVFIALTGEEIGLKGSEAFVKNPPFPLSKIKFLINFDLAGTGDEGIQVVNSTVFKKKAALLDTINAEKNLLPQIKKRGEACNSDHCYFYEKGVRCFYIYTLGGIRAYHDVYDKSETLPFTGYNGYFELIKEFVERL